MRKVIVVCCIAALLLAATTAAMASSAYWVLKLKSGWYDGASMVSYYTVTLGADPTGVASGASAPLSATYTTVSTGASYYITHRLDSDNPAPYTFTMTVAPGTGTSDHVGNQHEGMMYMTAWTPETYTGISGRAMPSTYQVRVMDGATQLALWSYADLYRAADPAAAGTGAVGFWYDYAGHYSSYAEAATAGEQFTVIVENVPEPGSFVALGGGLVGLVGFAIRRRRA